MHIIVLCATERGYLFIKKLYDLCRKDTITIFSFREEPWEQSAFHRIKEFALSHGFNFYETKKIDSPHLERFWTSTPIDLMFVVSWRYIIPESLYKRAKYGCVVFHDSLLPKYRGRAPTNWAIINGEEKTGATIFFIDRELDAGPIIDQMSVDIGFEDTIEIVSKRVTQAYLALLEKNIEKLKRGNSKARPQNHQDATYTCKRIPEDGLINWSASSLSIYNLIRALAIPWPGAYTYLDGKKLFLWSAKLPQKRKVFVGLIPGRVWSINSDGTVEVLTGDGSIILEKVQLENRGIEQASSIINSYSSTLKS